MYEHGHHFCTEVDVNGVAGMWKSEGGESCVIGSAL